jgi:hypothetical protein
MGFAFDKQVGTSGSTGAGGTFDKKLPGDLDCKGGASITVSGELSVGIKPELKATFGFFKLKTASFTVTGHAHASVSFDANGSVACDTSTHNRAGPLRDVRGSGGSVPGGDRVAGRDRRRWERVGGRTQPAGSASMARS